MNRVCASNFPTRSLYHADNLTVLRGMNSAIVDLVATDPPFNKAKDFHALLDSQASGATFTDRWDWNRDIRQEWIDTIKSNYPGVDATIVASRVTYGNSMAAFLCWLGIRLIECHRVLKPTGSLYLQIDHTSHAYVKMLLDGIFGCGNFRSEIVWQAKSRSGFKSQRNGWIRDHDILLYYRKSEAFVFNKQIEPYSPEYISQMFRDTGADGRRYRERGYRRFYEDEGGIPYGDVWTDVPSFQTAVNSSEITGYPTQKPVELYERIIKASSNEGDMVLDPFCGSGTTLVAAERLGRQWVGIDIASDESGVVTKRLMAERQLLRDITACVSRYTIPPVRSDSASSV